MKSLFILFVLCFFNYLFGMENSNRKYSNKATQELIEIIETRNETVGSSHFDTNETIHSLRTLIKQGANPNALNSQGRNVLWLAITLRNKPLFQCILHKGTNVNQEDNKGDTPLKFAISQMALEVLKMLIASGADVNHQSISKFGRGKTPLMEVFHLGSGIRLAIINILLRADANVFLKDRGGQTVLHFAASQGDLKMIQCLFNFNHCCVLLKDDPENNGITPLYLARNKPQIIAFLQQSAQKIK